MPLTIAADIVKFIDVDGIHPIDEGHLLMWKFFQDFLKLTDSQTNYRINGQNATLTKSLIFANNWIERSNAVSHVSKTGNIVDLSFSITGGTTTKATIIFSVPNGFIPKKMVELS